MEHSAFFSRWAKVVAGPKTKWLTLVVWVLLAIVTSLLAPAVNKEENNQAALLPQSSASVQAAAKVKAAFPSDAGTPALMVWYRKDGLTLQDFQRIAKVARYLHEHPAPEQQSVAPLYQLPPNALATLASKDGTTLVLPVNFNASAASTTLQTSLALVRHDVTTVLGSDPFTDTSITTGGLHARITGPAGIATDALGLFKNADFALLTATTLLVLILLILLYRSPVLALVPLVSVGFAYSIVSPLLGALARSGVIVVDAQGVSIMTVLLFGAGTDYCLFLVARYRERLFHISDKHQALREAVGGAAGAIIMSGLTVVLSLLTLLFARYGSDHRFAIPFSLAILVMALTAVTLVPALLAILGRGSFFPFIPRTEGMLAERLKRSKPVRHGNKGEPGRLSRWIGHVVSRRPWPVAIAGVVVLVVLAGFSTQVKTTYNLLESFPKTMPSRQGFTLLADHFSPGSLAPVQVLVKDKKTSAAKQVQSDLKTLPFVAFVSQGTRSIAMPQFTLFQVTLKQDPYTTASMNDIPVIRSTVEKSLTAHGIHHPGNYVWIGGETATQYDTRALTVRDTRLVIPMVIGVIALLLLVYLRSVIAMVYLISTVLLSYFSALGTGWLILHDVMGASAISGAIPLYAFVFLVALGEDYNIFMVSRIWQERRKRPLGDAIFEGVSRTSSVITSAGLILAGTFAVLASLPIQVLVQFGIVTAIGVLLDTFIVRPFVVPALTSILGQLAFWPGRSPVQSPGPEGNL